MARDDAGAANPTKASGATATQVSQVKRHRHPAKPPDAGVAAKASTAAGAIKAGEQVVKTDKTVNDNAMKILPP